MIFGCEEQINKVKHAKATETRKTCLTSMTADRQCCVLNCVLNFNLRSLKCIKEQMALHLFISFCGFNL